MSVRGKAHIFGDHVDTDQIIPAQYLSMTDPKELAKHCMETADRQFVKNVRPGDFIVAGVNFGCGSSREHAQISIIGTEVNGVIAKSFARIFFRNSINQGLPLIECPEAAEAIEAGDEIEVDFASGMIRNLTSKDVFQAKPYEPFLIEILDAGGIIEYTKQKLAKQRA